MLPWRSIFRLPSLATAICEIASSVRCRIRGCHRIALSSRSRSPCCLKAVEKNTKILRASSHWASKSFLMILETGYSSLLYLSMFAFDKVKIDRSFVSQMSNRPDCAAIVRSIIGLGQDLNMTTVAEERRNGEATGDATFSRLLGGTGLSFRAPSAGE